MAREAGVSRTTVSYVLNGRTDLAIPEKTRKRVLEAAAQLGYRNHPIARALKTGRTHLIGLWLAQLHTPWVGLLQRTFYHVLRHDGYTPVALDLGVQHEEQVAGEETLARLPLDGAFVNAYSALAQRSGEGLLPLVAIGAEPEHQLPLDSVGLDFGPGVQTALEHLIAAGRKRVAYLFNGERPFYDVRGGTYETMLREAGQAPCLMSAKANSRADAYEALTVAWRRGERPDAVFCYNDELAIGAQAALFDSGVRVPDDVALIGCDGVPEGEFLRPRLQSVAIPTEELCAQAWQFLQERIADPKRPLQQAMLTPRFVLHNTKKDTPIFKEP